MSDGGNESCELSRRSCMRARSFDICIVYGELGGTTQPSHAFIKSNCIDDAQGSGAKLTPDDLLGGSVVSLVTDVMTSLGLDMV